MHICPDEILAIGGITAAVKLSWRWTLAKLSQFVGWL